jgi:beta-glucanase (GH16 family)
MASKGASAFWFYRNTPEHWTEIDVFEMCAGGSPEAGKMHTNAHIFLAPGVTKEVASPASFPVSPDPDKEFHVYAVEWDIDSVKWYLDGQLLRRLDNTQLRYSLHLLFDTETMDGWFGLPDKKSLPSTFEIEYVRAWQKR